MKEKKWFELFELGILFKTITGSLEIFSGLLVLFVSKTTIVHLFTYFTADELLEDPHDHIMIFLSNTLHSLTTGAQFFAALYILLHGAVNLGLAICLYYKKMWAYTSALYILTIFVLYQLYRFTYSHASGLLLVTILDIIFIVVIWHERRLRLQIET